MLWVVLAFAPVSALRADATFDVQSVRDCSVQLLRDSAWGLSGAAEHAAFIIDRGDGVLDCMPWPHTHAYLSEVYHGPIPAGTIAVVHTHPAVRPFPSNDDVDEASRIGLPIYVLTISGVRKAEPNRTVQTVAIGRKWMRPPKPILVTASP